MDSLRSRRRDKNLHILIKLYGFTLLRNGVKYDYSFRESFTSLSQLCEEVYVAVDRGDDNSWDEVAKLPKMKIIPSVWDMSLKKGLVLSVETNKALTALRADHGLDDSAWGIYLQADEVLHEDDYELLRADIAKASAEGADALSFRYLHFWQTHHHIAVGKKWYPHEIRAIKLKTNIESWGDAQGFRNQKKVFYTEARIYHYGHVREQDSYAVKMRDMGKLYHEAEALEERLEKGLKDARKNKCELYFGTHPLVMKERIIKMNDIWELPVAEEVVIVGNPQKYPERLIQSIAARKVTWFKSYSDVPAALKNRAIITDPGIVDVLFGRAKKFDKMKSKLARPWSDSFRLIMQISSKNLGFRHD